MGDLIRCGPFSFNVLEVVYKSQLAESPVAKRPGNLFIAIRLQATNSGGNILSLPLMKMESESGVWIPELEDASGFDGWLGLLRPVEPGATETGWMVFDAPAGNYGLRLTDSAFDAGDSVSVRIPLQPDAG